MELHTLNFIFLENFEDFYETLGKFGKLLGNFEVFT